MTDCFVGIDTSNYTTSAAVCTADGRVIANLKRPLPVKEGACGLRQSDALFAHVKQLPELMQSLAEVTRELRVLAVGCSSRPRNVADSYMPCFLAGVAAANSFAAASNLPVFECSHQEGHVMAAVYSSGASERILEGPFAAFHVSGGTTEVLSVTPNDVGFDITLVGKTMDLNAGQAIDRAGVMMGISFPCGKEMELLAKQNQSKLPRARVCVREGNCHLSGLQNITEELWRSSQDASFVSAYVFSFIGETLRLMTEQFDRIHSHVPVVYAGGVMSNRYLQGVLAARPDTYFAEPQFSADNAAGVALLCQRRYLAQTR